MAESAKKAKLDMVGLLNCLSKIKSNYIRRGVLHTAGFPGDQVQQWSTLDVQNIINAIDNVGLLRVLRAPYIREMILRQVGLSQRLTDRLIQIVNHDYYNNNRQPQLEEDNNNQHTR